jgi:tetratricopeptide (TPR) repeat protein
MGDLNEWLKLAPQPSLLEPGREWHVFLSYRSSDRAWVLSLYDILTQLNYSVFMDQFVLNSGGPLTRSLEENLEASQAGVLIWSTRSNDSDWCRREYESFVTLQTERNFRFVIAQLQSGKLPLFARNAIWENFAEQRDGPTGTALLRLLYGLHGKPVPDRAIRLAEDIDQQTKRGLALLKTHSDAQDAVAIAQLAQSDDLAWQASPLLPCAAAEALISMRAHNTALTLLDRIGTAFPRSVRPRQLRGLALARSGRWKEARAALGELYELGERDPETIGIYARTWMDSFNATGDRLHLRRSRDLYAEGFGLVPDNYYLGVNAAAKSIFLNELDAGREFAQRVQAVLGDKAKAGDYWHTATVAEVQLIQGKFSQAAHLYGQAVAMTPGRIDDHASTCKQARRLLEHLAPAPEEASKVLAVFRRVVQATDSTFAVEAIRGSGQKVVTFCGFSGTGYEDPVEVERIVREQLARFTAQTTIICAGATAEGIGMVYPIARRKGFCTIGIVSSLAEAEGVAMSDDVEVVYIIKDDSWGGRRGTRLSPTSEAMVEACDEMIGIGGGAIARDELEEARRRGKAVTFIPAETNHARAAEKARKAGKPPPADFRGEAYTLFQP